MTCQTKRLAKIAAERGNMKEKKQSPVCCFQCEQWAFRNSITKENEKCYPDFHCVSFFHQTFSYTLQSSNLYFSFLLTYQDGGDYIGSVQQSISVIAASHEAGCGHILLIFIPVTNLGKKKISRGLKLEFLTSFFVQNVFFLEFYKLRLTFKGKLE